MRFRISAVNENSISSPNYKVGTAGVLIYAGSGNHSTIFIMFDRQGSPEILGGKRKSKVICKLQHWGILGVL